MSVVTPKDQLLSYQRAWVDDEARFKVGVWSRQTGKDYSTGAEVAEDCFRRPKTTWMIAAPSERQALESLEKAKEWVQAYEIAIADAFEERERKHGESLLKAATVVLPNGSRVIAVPGKPETVRGFSANLVLTEFAFFEDPLATWRAVVPSITNPLRGGKKRVRIISTPNGRGDQLHAIWEENYVNPRVDRRTRWSCHKVTIHDAAAMGLPVDIEELREAYGDPEGWAQEFECVFLDGSATLLPYDLIAGAEATEATVGVPSEWWRAVERPVYLGIDFGRQNDPTVCWALEQVGDVLWTREVLVLRGMSTPAQEEILRERVATATRVCMDYTGPGIGLGDYLVREHGEHRPDRHSFGKVELCVFTPGFQREVFPRLRRLFEAPVGVRVPISREVREDLHAVQQSNEGGVYRYWAPRTREGHSDRCTALALAARAASESGGALAYEPVRSGRRWKGAGL